MTQSSLQPVLQKFNITGAQFRYSPLTAGLINDTYLVTTAEHQQYILQKINTQVFSHVGELMKNINHALTHLSATDYAPITFVNTKNGENCLQENGVFWRMMTYIPNSTTYNTTTNTNIAYEAGRIIGKFHSLLSPVDPNLFYDTLPKFHDLDHRTHQFEQALQSADSTKLKTAKEAIKKAHSFLNELQDLDYSKLPLRICHNDTKLNNILFSKNTDKALCLIDLDTLMKGYFFYDFGDAIRTVVNTAPEDEKDHHKIIFDEPMFTAFIDGLATHPHLLTKAEKESLPLGAVFMPFLHGLRALTDYLNNNIYYKVAYENQNLDRCLSLFHFAEKALQNKDLMAAYIQRKLH
ncbi:phosphotransferase enzyme family protein [Maribacter sp. LLG6340-A2]|uniref:phosphotransferase enzyme family protein n=1 Tax=Maribacter sp. LLG6340-A2 TaxID=3160834 RepID=UPI003868057F